MKSNVSEATIKKFNFDVVATDADVAAVAFVYVHVQVPTSGWFAVTSRSDVDIFTTENSAPAAVPLRELAPAVPVNGIEKHTSQSGPLGVCVLSNV